MLKNFTWVSTTPLANCLPVFRLKMVRTNVMVFIGNEPLLISIHTSFCISERTMANYNSSSKSKPCKRETSGTLQSSEKLSSRQGVQVCAGDQICPFCGRDISRGVNFWYLHAGNVESTLRMIEALLLKIKVFLSIKISNFSEYEKFYFSMEIFLILSYCCVTYWSH